MSDQAFDKDWPDPNKWYYEEVSGEFYKIVEILPDGNVVFSNMPYNKRWLEWSQYRFGTRLSGWIVGICLPLFIFNYATDGWSGTSIAFALVLGFWIPFLLFMAAKLLARDSAVGPEPRRRPLTNTIHQQLQTPRYGKNPYRGPLE